jgi:hypothetical protein
MKRILLLAASLALFTCSAFAQITYNSFASYDPYWYPLGNPNTATYGETFAAPPPQDGDFVLDNFSLYLAGPVTSGNIDLSGYVATWTGTHAGTLVYSSPEVDYPNTGDAELTFDTGGISLLPGATYVAFLSVSQYYGDSSGESYISIANTGFIPAGSFVFYNNGGDFGSLFDSTWDATGLQPDLAFTANFTSAATPEPGTVGLLGVGLIGMFGAFRRRLSI